MIRILFALLFILTGFSMGYAYRSQQLNSQGKSSPSSVTKASPLPLQRNEENSKAIVLRRSSDHIQTTPQQPKKTEPQAFARYLEFLDKQQYIDAMQVYTDAVSENPVELIRYKREILTRLKNILSLSSADNDTMFIDLSDAFLSQYYSDTDVLLLLAEFNRKQFFLSEAAQNYEFAHLYANSADDRVRVRSEFISFVNIVDSLLSEQEDWFRLLSFYQNIILLELHTQYHQLRYGKLLVLTDNIDEAIASFSELVDDRLVGSDARAALRSLQKNEPQSPVRRSTNQWDESIAMQRHGHHYLVKLEINKRQQMSLLLDTGASITSVSRYAFDQLRERHRFDFLGTRLFSTANGVSKGWVYRADEVKLGGFRLKDVELVAMSLPPNDYYDGLLGMNILRNFRFEIDQDAAELKLSKRKKR